MRNIACLLILTVISLNSALGQTAILKGFTIDAETHDTIPHVKLKLTIDLQTGFRDTVMTTSDKHGYFVFKIQQTVKFYVKNIKTTDLKYRQEEMNVSLSDTSKLITYYLNEPGYRDYFQEFSFDENSATPKDTNSFYDWDLHKYTNAAKKIKVKGFYAPNENKAIALKRAQAVVDGFVIRGANRQAFVIENDTCSMTRLNYGHYVEFNNVEYFFKKGAKIDAVYIDDLSSDRKEAAKQLLRAVKLEWYSEKK